MPSELVPDLPSANLRELSIRGHRAHIWTAAALFSTYFVSALLLQVAYQWDRLRRPTLVAVPIIFGVLTSAVIWFARSIVKGERINRRISVGRNFSWFMLPIVVVYAGACSFVLPNTDITGDHTAGWTARTEYLRDVLYIIPIVRVFLIELFRSVVALEGEVSNGNGPLLAPLLRGTKASIPPRGVFFIRPGWLWMVVAVLMPVYTFLTWHLIDSLEPSRFRTLFLDLAFLRIGSYLALIVECVAWYHRTLNQMRSEVDVNDSRNRLARNSQ
jgi:hypothetical protein